MREQIMAPLLGLFKAQKQFGSSLLEKLMTFLGAISLPENLERMVATFSENDQESTSKFGEHLLAFSSNFKRFLDKKNCLWMNF